MIFAFRYFQGDPLAFFIYLLFTLVAVTVSLVLHEVAHGLVAKWNGDYTAKNMGRLSLNPLKHMDPVGFIMMMLVGFGYAKPVPVNPSNFTKYRRGMITVAIAGVVMNLTLAFIATFFLVLMFYCALNATSYGTYEFCVYMMNFFEILATVNLALLFFNILPIFPLDGFRVVEAFTHYGNRFCAFMRTNGQYILYGLVGLSFIVSMATDRFSLPSWFEYLDVLGTYLRFFAGKVEWLFVSLWKLIFF